MSKIAWHDRLEHRHRVALNNAVGIDCTVFHTFASRHRWLEISGWMPVANAPDAELDDIVPQLPRQNEQITVHGTCGKQPDEVLIDKETAEGPVGKLGALRIVYALTIEEQVHLLIAAANRVTRNAQDVRDYFRRQRKEEKYTKQSQAKDQEVLDISGYNTFHYDPELKQTIKKEAKKFKEVEEDEVEKKYVSWLQAYYDSND